MLQRLQAHADLHLFDDALRTFVQVENTRAFGKDLYSPNDEGRNEIRQAFIDFNHDFAAGRYTTRVGRQEMAFGDQVFVTYRDVPNLRLSFDGVRASLNLKDGRKLDAFAVRPLKTGEDSWDDGSNNAVKFYGLYGTLPLTAVWNMDLFAFGLQTDDRSLAGEAGDEQRYTYGTRLFGRYQALDWSWNLAGQGGHLGGARSVPGQCRATVVTPSTTPGSRAWACVPTPPAVIATQATARSAPSTRCSRETAFTVRPA